MKIAIRESWKPCWRAFAGPLKKSEAESVLRLLPKDRGQDWSLGRLVDHSCSYCFRRRSSRESHALSRSANHCWAKVTASGLNSRMISLPRFSLFTRPASSKIVRWRVAPWRVAPIPFRRVNVVWGPPRASRRRISCRCGSESAKKIWVVKLRMPFAILAVRNPSRHCSRRRRSLVDLRESA